MAHSFTDSLSERDVAWFEELAETLERGCAALSRQTRAGSPVASDTALSLIAAMDAGTPDEDAVRELLARGPQPDVDATALVLIALARSGNATHTRCSATIHDAINTLLPLQNRDGGWPAFEHEPSCAGVTARVLEALGHFGFRVGQPPIGAAVKFLLACQEESGEWRNRHGASGLQTTWQTIAGLRAVGFDVFAIPVRRAVRWLKESQNEDAGWGGSTPTETAWAVLALLAADERGSAEVRAGAEFLVGTQRADGTWSEGACFPLMALGRYLLERVRPAEPRKTFARTDAGHRASGPKVYRHTLAEM